MSDLFGQAQADPGLFAYLNQYQQPQRRTPPAPSEGDNYGYASSAPRLGWEQLLALGVAPSALAGAVHGFRAGAPGVYGRIGGAAVGALLGGFGAENLSKGSALLDRYGVPTPRAAERFVSQSDAMASGLDAMRYYGHDNMRGPR